MFEVRFQNPQHGCPILSQEPGIEEGVVFNFEVYDDSELFDQVPGWVLPIKFSSRSIS